MQNENEDLRERLNIFEDSAASRGCDGVLDVQKLVQEKKHLERRVT